jgi:hypothetical protein
MIDAEKEALKDIPLSSVKCRFDSGKGVSVCDVWYLTSKDSKTFSFKIKGIKFKLKGRTESEIEKELVEALSGSTLNLE